MCFLSHLLLQFTLHSIKKSLTITFPFLTLLKTLHIILLLILLHNPPLLFPINLRLHLPLLHKLTLLLIHHLHTTAYKPPYHLLLISVPPKPFKNLNTLQTMFATTSILPYQPPTPLPIPLTLTLVSIISHLNPPTTFTLLFQTLNPLPSIKFRNTIVGLKPCVLNYKLYKTITLGF